METGNKQSLVLYPIGVQTFEKIREGHYLYIDKTAYVYKLVSDGGYFFLSRPRRFGKSMLLSTIEAYFRGRRDLFKGLAIDSLTDSWEEYPVLHLDLNSEEYKTEESLIKFLDNQLRQWENEYGIRESNDSISMRFARVIQNAYERTGRQVVILVDEYDKPMLNAVDDEELADRYRSILKAFYGNLKSSDRYIKFAMLTGVARFSKVSIFSDLNNLNDISFDRDFSAICGVSAEELPVYFNDSIARLAEENDMTVEDTVAKLKETYDGYHFSKKMVDVYNPFNLMNVFYKNEFDNYWFKTGTPSHVVKLLRSGSWDVRDLSGYRIKATRLSTEGIMSRDPIPTLFQAGYLTIASYRPDLNQYTLDYPNREVKESFLEFLLQRYTTDSSQRTDFDITRFVEEVEDGRIDSFMTRVSSLISSVPYREKGEAPEAHFQSVVYMIFTLLGFYTRMEDRVSNGRIDVTVETTDYVYVFEFKIGRCPEDALEQIKEKRYWEKYSASGRRIILIGANFDSSDRNMTGYVTEEVTV